MVESSSSRQLLRAAAVTVTVNSAGELCSANSQPVPYSVTAAGGTLSGDNTDLGSFTGNVTVTADSKLRLGDFFGSTNRNLTLSGKLIGSANLSLISSLSNTPTGKTLFLTTGDNSGYTGAITVPVGTGATGGYNVVLGSNLGVGGSLNVSSSSAYLTTVTIKDTGTSGGFIPTITTPVAATGNGGALLYQGGLLNGPLDMSTVGDGFWFLGSPTAGGSAWLPNGFKPGAGNVYRLGGGGGQVYFGNPSLVDYNSTPSSIIVGDTRGTNGGGTVRLDNANTLSGDTTIAAGTLLVTNTSGSALGTGNAQLNGGTFAGTGTISGTITASGGNIAPGNSGPGTLTVGGAESWWIQHDAHGARRHQPWNCGHELRCTGFHWCDGVRRDAESLGDQFVLAGAGKCLRPFRLE